MESSAKKHIIRFLLKMLFIALVLVACDWGTGKILKQFYFRQFSGFSYRTTYAIDSTTAEIIILGSSRANHNYVPEVIEDSLHYTSYNAGRDGNYVLYNYAIFKSITKRYNPKMIIIDIQPSDIDYNKTEYERLSALLPYYQMHPEIRQIVCQRGPFEKIKLFSKIYPYNSMILQIAVGNIDKNKTKQPDIKGYVPIFRTIKDEKIDTTRTSTTNVDETKMSALKEIISTCKQKGIKLVFVYSPIRIIIRDTYYYSLSGLCSENGIRYLDMSNDQTFLSNYKYFADYDHLNDEGARLFSAMLADKIKRTD